MLLLMDARWPVVLPIFSFLTTAVVVFFSVVIQRRSVRVSVPATRSQKPVGPSAFSLWGFSYGRRIVYCIAIVWAFFLYYRVSMLPNVSASLSALTRWYGLTALFLLFPVLTPGLIVSFFPRFSWNAVLIHLRRSAGVSLFLFAFLHATIAFFHNLSGNIASIFFLAKEHQAAIFASSVAFVIYASLAVTSFDFMVSALGNRRWKTLHRLVYGAGILSLFHAFLIGSHFTNPTAAVPLLINYLGLTYVMLEVSATVTRFRRQAARISLGKTIIRWGLLALLIGAALFFSHLAVVRRFDPHAQHRKGYSKNYEVRVAHSPEAIVPGIPVRLTANVIDKRTNQPVKKFQVTQEKLMHLIVLQNDLSFYDHIHPEYDGNGGFSVTEVFPAEAVYTLYFEYSPPDFYENVSTVVVRTDKAPSDMRAHIAPGPLAGTFGGQYAVSLSASDDLVVNRAVDFTYTLRDAGTGKDITDLEPYLGAFGHMSAVSEDLQTYTHVHPVNVPLSALDRGGPVVKFNTFFPKKGTYKLFTQFKLNAQLFITDFVVEVK